VTYVRYIQNQAKINKDDDMEFKWYKNLKEKPMSKGDYDLIKEIEKNEEFHMKLFLSQKKARLDLEHERKTDRLLSHPRPPLERIRAIANSYLRKLNSLERDAKKLTNRLKLCSMVAIHFCIEIKAPWQKDTEYQDIYEIPPPSPGRLSKAFSYEEYAQNNNYKDLKNTYINKIAEQKEKDKVLLENNNNEIIEIIEIDSTQEYENESNNKRGIHELNNETIPPEDNTISKKKKLNPHEGHIEPLAQKSRERRNTPVVSPKKRKILVVDPSNNKNIEEGNRLVVNPLNNKNIEEGNRLVVDLSDKKISKKEINR